MDMFDVDSTIKDGDSDTFATYAEAVAYADQLADEWEAATELVADRSWASRDNMYAIKCGNHSIQVISSEESN